MSTAAGGSGTRASHEQATIVHPVAAANTRSLSADHARPAPCRAANKPLSPTQNCGVSSGYDHDARWGAVSGRASVNVRSSYVMTDGTSPIYPRTAEQPFFPRFGDIVFSREPSVTSYAIRASYALPPLRRPTPVEVFNSDNSFSHAAFVTDGNTIIHATKKGPVDLVSLRHFFATEGIEYAVLREPNNDKTDDYYRSTYYLGQDYDVGFVSRFLKRNPAAGKQVCSTLTANMLDQFGLAKIPQKDVISPKELIVELRKCGWSKQGRGQARKGSQARKGF